MNRNTPPQIIRNSQQIANPERLIGLDWLKLVAIVCVVVYHCQIFFQSAFAGAIMSIGVPVFFAVNGFLMLNKNRPLDYYIKKNIKIVFLILFYGLVATTIAMACKSEPVNIKDVVLHIKNQDVGYSIYLWFLCALFCLNCLCPILRAFIEKDRMNCYYLFCLAFWCVILRQVSWHLNFLTSWWGSFSIVYYVLGYLLISAKVKIQRVYLWIAIVTGVVLHAVSNILYNSGYYTGFLTKISAIFDRSFDGYGYWTIFIFIVVGSVLLLLKDVTAPLPPLLSFISRNTLGIYLISGPVNKALMTLYPEVLGLNILFPVIVLMLTLALIFVIKKIPLVSEIVAL